MSIQDTNQVRHVLDIPAWAPTFWGYIDRDATQFRDTTCDCCEQPAAVYIEFTVNDDIDGWISTDATYCGEHATDEVRCILDRADRSTDHNTDVTLNYWAIQYGAFGTHASAVAA